MKQWSAIMKNISLLSQLGLSLCMPLLLCMLLCYKLTVWFSLGSWVYIPGFVLGLGGGYMTAYKLYQAVVGKQDRKKRRKDPVAFNRHQ